MFTCHTSMLLFNNILWRIYQIIRLRGKRKFSMFLFVFNLINSRINIRRDRLLLLTYRSRTLFAHKYELNICVKSSIFL